MQIQNTALSPFATFPQAGTQSQHQSNTPFIYYMKGDNMAPTIKAGDYLLVKPCNRYISDGIYLIDIQGKTQSVKRIFQGVLRPTLSIINDSAKYPNYQAEPCEVNIIGKVCEVLTRKAV